MQTTTEGKNNNSNLDSSVLEVEEFLSNLGLQDEVIALQKKTLNKDTQSIWSDVSKSTTTSLVGGALAVGVGVISAPTVIVGGVGYAISKFVKQQLKKNKFPEEERLRLYKLALLKQQAIIDALKEDNKVCREKADYLQSLNEVLQEAIKELKSNTTRQ